MNRATEMGIAWGCMKAKITNLDSTHYLLWERIDDWIGILDSNAFAWSSILLIAPRTMKKIMEKFPIY